jgi:hypothetical protein
MMKQMPKCLDQLIGRPGCLARLTNSREGDLLFFIEIDGITHKQPNGILGGEILQRNSAALRFLDDAPFLA